MSDHKRKNDPNFKLYLQGNLIEEVKIYKYRLKDDKDLLEQYRANIELRNNSKIKFKTRTTKLTKVANSPYYRGVRLWDRLNESTQKATTKVKFKQLIA